MREPHSSRSHENRHLSPEVTQADYWWLLHLSLALLPDRLGALALSEKLAAGFVGVPDAAPLEKVPKTTLFDADSLET